MFRLVFLTFHGERRHDAPAPQHPKKRSPCAFATAHASHAARSARLAPRTAAHLHDAPPAMALALIVLALGSVLAGYVGIPAALGGHNALGAWLAPSFTARSVTTLPAAQVGEAGEAGAAEGAGQAGGGTRAVADGRLEHRRARRHRHRRVHLAEAARDRRQAAATFPGSIGCC